MKSKIIVLIGAVITVYGLLLCIMSNINLGVVLVAALGIAVLGIGFFYGTLSKLKHMRFFRICKVVFVILLGFEIALISFLAIYGLSDNADYSDDAVIVLGAGIRGDKVTIPLKLRLDKAIEYHRKNPDALIVVSGGKGLQEIVTEAYAMEKYLLENGVDKNKIIKEEQSTSTSENMKFSKEILDSQQDGDYSVVVITNHFHIFRAAVMAEDTGFKKVGHIHAGLQWYNLMPCFMRESLAVLKMLVIG